MCVTTRTVFVLLDGCLIALRSRNSYRNKVMTLRTANIICGRARPVKTNSIVLTTFTRETAHGNQFARCLCIRFDVKLTSSSKRSVGFPSVHHHVRDFFPSWFFAPTGRQTTFQVDDTIGAQYLLGIAQVGKTNECRTKNCSRPPLVSKPRSCRVERIIGYRDTPGKKKNSCWRSLYRFRLK